jgi:signal recognition particle subunit SRP72
MGRTEESAKHYNHVLKQKPNDISLAAVASNNLVAINKDANVFDSKKKMKVATADGVQLKLTSKQQETISTNQSLLFMHTNQKQIAGRKTPSASLKLKLAQLYMTQGHVYQACTVLRDMGNLSYKPGVVSALVTLYMGKT